MARTANSAAILARRPMGVTPRDVGQARAPVGGPHHKPSSTCDIGRRGASGRAAVAVMPVSMAARLGSGLHPPPASEGATCMPRLARAPEVFWCLGPGACWQREGASRSAKRSVDLCGESPLK